MQRDVTSALTASANIHHRTWRSDDVEHDAADVWLGDLHLYFMTTEEIQITIDATDPGRPTDHTQETPEKHKNGIL
ncbi:hypothetical protein Zmor_027457 [Zophobas morio]|uniref:Uncharacterized protein n=1 Tax=Zophobas morio TaxID=2755281 RepID=A0AA38HPE4_9CUCU|nr:hypothetical protein Zmor_027457 [Zophobas morio]